MRPFRVYIDTSVVGGCLDKEFAEDSRRVFDEAISGRIVLLISDLVIAELGPAPGEVKAVLGSVPAQQIEEVGETDDVIRLRDAYIKAKVIGGQWLADATHVAMATVARADAIVSWNFRHIVRLDRIKAYNQVNLAEGYGILTILSPREVRYDDAATEAPKDF
jgi:predicted nucleic acid-binding protein